MSYVLITADRRFEVRDVDGTAGIGGSVGGSPVKVTVSHASTIVGFVDGSAGDDVDANELACVVLDRPLYRPLRGDVVIAGCAGDEVASVPEAVVAGIRHAAEIYGWSESQPVSS